MDKQTEITIGVALLAVILITCLFAIKDADKSVSKEIIEIRRNTGLRCVVPKYCIMFATAQERDDCIGKYIYCEK